MTTILTKQEYSGNWFVGVEQSRLEATIEALHRYAVAAEAYIPDVGPGWDEHHAGEEEAVDEYEAARKVLADAGWLE